MSQWLLARSLSGWSYSKYSVSTPFCYLALLIMSSGCSRSRLLSSFPFVSCHNNASGTLCLMPAFWTASKTNSSNRNRHLVNFPEASVDVSNHFKASCLVLVMKWPSVMYGRSNNTAHTIARKFLWLVASFCSTLVSVDDQYRIDRTIPSYSYFRSMR